ncbi:hypothetical protein [Pseudomonas sichuanensis]|uniref:hypothetical protein n=1 Tax=Pseudomonas TaxID=286 RepID=UPI0036EE65D4
MGVLDPTAQRFKSIVVGVMPDGSLGIASSDKEVPKAQREFAEDKGLADVSGVGHAEETLINAGATHVDANRGVCLDCETMMRDNSVSTDTPFAGKKSKRGL